MNGTLGALALARNHGPEDTPSCARCLADLDPPSPVTDPLDERPEPVSLITCTDCAERIELRDAAGWPRIDPAHWPAPTNELAREDKLRRDIALRGRERALADAREREPRTGVYISPGVIRLPAVFRPPVIEEIPPPPPVTVALYARLCGKSPSWVYTRIREGMPTTHGRRGWPPTRKLLIDPTAARRWLARRHDPTRRPPVSPVRVSQSTYACPKCDRRFDAANLPDPSQWQLAKAHAAQHAKHCRATPPPPQVEPASDAGKYALFAGTAQVSAHRTVGAAGRAAALTASADPLTLRVLTKTGPRDPTPAELRSFANGRKRALQ